MIYKKDYYCMTNMYERSKIGSFIFKIIKIFTKNFTKKSSEIQFYFVFYLYFILNIQIGLGESLRIICFI